MPDLQDAISLLEKGNAREASVVLKTMAAEMPGYATARVLLARSYEGLGDWGGALAAWREAMHIVPNSPVILRGLERVARKAASGATAEELPSVTVSTP
ncbi:MAG: tetratricopeptide repeat protein, partial [Rhodothermales bacterium]